MIFRALCNICPFDADRVFLSWEELRQHILEKHPERATQFPEKQPQGPHLKENQ